MNSRRPLFRVTSSAAVMLAAICLAAAVAACGKDAPPAPPTASQVFVKAMKALETGNLGALEAVLSPAGRDQVRRDLLAWRALLVDAIQGPRLLSRLPTGAAAPPKALVDRAMVGDPASVLALFVAIEPHPWGDTPPPREPTASPTELFYRTPDGVERRVILSKSGDAWSIDQLML